jgi:hypothetical protein
MASTQHFDALLIGALYGELSLTQRAELDAHLLAHPADATTFDQLTTVRHAISAYVAQVSMVEPPQAISAILLQEATRKAPKRDLVRATQGGWFARLRNGFIAHPAWAAAATLVMVAGVGSALYVRGARVAAPTASVQATAVVTTQVPAAAAPPVAAAAIAKQESQDLATEQSKAKAYQAGLADDSSDKSAATIPTKSRSRAADGAMPIQANKNDTAGKKMPSKIASDLKAADKVDADGAFEAGEFTPTVSRDQTVQPAVNAVSGGGFAQAPSQAPKQAPSKKSGDFDDSTATGRQTTAEDEKSKDKPLGKVEAAPAPLARPPAPTTIATTSSEESVEKSPKSPAPEDQSNVVRTWAQMEHDKLKKLVAAGKCIEASRIGASISARAPDYYQQNVATDRQVQACLAEIRQKRSSKEKSSPAVTKPSKKP